MHMLGPVCILDQYIYIRVLGAQLPVCIIIIIVVSF